ncbi:rhodanese-like domain-containing protein [Thalassovita aquimarina]|uniref:Rhodanese-like domain-containing protein n=1 Tax=Thalassovita aquimarina TaxID=2785917 RepID=A0ABS5HQK8_9RHOB|nr:rhodanese-like domain-containing protein [Thalassovita aquimarina]MBR9651230.1 rhodanese-like domain-containing protein [Thalassovita aquimarina]
MTKLTTIVAAALIGFTGPALAQDDAVAEAIVDYMDFATYESGIILPQQIDRAVFEAATFVDTRDADQYEAGHIPGATHIEWREIPGRIDELPEDGMVILYCNTGSLSAQATFAARLMGRENVLVLQTGFTGWQEEAAWKPE